METKTSDTEKSTEGKSPLSDKKAFGGESEQKLKEMGERTAEADTAKQKKPER